MPTTDLIDTHAHLDEESFDVDRPHVVTRAVDSGVVRILTIGTTTPTSQRAVEIAAEYPPVYAVVGIQPNYVSQAKPGDWDTIVELASRPKVVGIGETGLDRYWDYAPLDLQHDYFQRHMALSQQLDLPFVVHCREAEPDVLDALRIAAKNGPLRGVMHSFCGSLETAKACLDLGLYISFAGMVTFKKSQNIRDVVPHIPADRILVETDSPYLAPQPHRGKRNEPMHVRNTANCLAELRGVSQEEFAQQTTANACELFRLELPKV